MIYDLYEKLLLNKPIKLGNCGYFHNPTINEILDLDKGFTTYNQWLSLICISKKDIQKMLNIEDEVSSFEFLYYNCLNEAVIEAESGIINNDSDSIKNIILTALSYFFKENVLIGNNCFYVKTEDRIIDKDIFDDIVFILKKVNFIKEKDDRKFKSDLAKQRYDELLKIREKIANAGKKENTRENIYKKSEWVNIISSISSKHASINLFNSGNLTIYQLIDQFKRINMIDEYYISIKSLLAGASKDDVQIIHWSDDIKDKDEEFKKLSEYEGLI